MGPALMPVGNGNNSMKGGAGPLLMRTLTMNIDKQKGYSPCMDNISIWIKPLTCFYVHVKNNLE